jgi:hypothetical protein
MMNTTHKRATSFHIGVARRKITIAKLETIFVKESTSFILRPVHNFMRVMTAAEKAENNTLWNRLQPIVGSDKAMGMDYVLEGEHTPKLHIVLRYFDDWSVYYKCPTDEKATWEDFVKGTLANTYFLFLDWPNVTRYRILKGDAFDWVRNNSKGNRNRLEMIANKRQDRIAPRLLNGVDILTGARTLFYDEPPLVKMLEDIMEEEKKK